MNSLEKWRLERYCEKHGVDVHEIDETLTYYENREHLSEFTVRSLEAYAKDWKSLREWFDSLSNGERFGYIEPTDELPLLIIECLVRYSQRSTSIVRQRLKAYRKHVNLTHRGYLIVRGQVYEVEEILKKIRDIHHKVLRRSLIYNKQREATWQWIPSKGWVKNRFGFNC